METQTTEIINLERAQIHDRDSLPFDSTQITSLPPSDGGDTPEKELSISIQSPAPNVVFHALVGLRLRQAVVFRWLAIRHRS